MIFKCCTNNLHLISFKVVITLVKYDPLKMASSFLDKDKTKGLVIGKHLYPEMWSFGEL